MPRAFAVDLTDAPLALPWVVNTVSDRGARFISLSYEVRGRCLMVVAGGGAKLAEQIERCPDVLGVEEISTGEQLDIG